MPPTVPPGVRVRFVLTAEQVGTSRASRAEAGNRFVAFTFAASEMVVEVDGGGSITYAAGAFRSRLGATADSFLGRHVTALVAPCDQDAIETALLLLRERGRLLPCMVRLANPGRTAAVLAGLKLAGEGAGSPACLTLGLPASPAGLVSHATTAQRLVQAAQLHPASARPGHLALLELSGDEGGGEGLAAALERIAPDALTSEVAPGRFGLLSPKGQDIAAVLPMVEGTLRGGGVVEVVTRKISLATGGLTPVQAARALRQALAVFARDGTAGVDKAGFGGGLAGYVEGAMLQASALRKAIVQRDFTLLYQPIVSLADRRVHHYEALLRPRRGMAAHSPQEFVALVETVGIADELDMAVAGMVCEAAEGAGTSIAVNLSGHSMQDPALRARLLEQLAASPAVQRGRILVEMTETAAVEDMDEVAETARGLRELGVKFCIDDFGAGTADIRLLRATPTDIVKLDGSFVPGITADGRERAFVSGMVEIARASGAAVVAERIETEAEAETVAEIGAQFGQGWLFGHPAELPKPAPLRPARRVGWQETWA